jgi:hypothetical protein
MASCVRSPVHRRVRWAPPLFRLAAAAFALPTLVAAQQVSSEIIRGRVRTPEGEPVAGAVVTVTGLQSLTNRSTHTDDQGRYTVLFGEGEGDYLVVARAIGYAPVGVRARNLGQSTFLTADVVLSRKPVQLDSVTVVASSARAHALDSLPNIGGSEQDVLGGRLFSLDPSDLAALATRVPGVMAIPGVYGDSSRWAVLGASPDQNSVTLDGSSFAGRALPPDAIAGATLATTTYNPSRGNFAGGQLAITTRRGNDRFQSSLRTAFTDPRLAWADPAAPTPVPRNLSTSGGVSGPIKRGAAYFNLALSNTTNTQDILSLLSLSGLQRTQYGLSPDTIGAVAGALGSLGVPITTSAIPDHATSTQRSAFLRLDATPTATTSLAMSLTGGESNQLGAGVSPLGFPSLGGGSRSSNLGLQVSASGYVHGLLDELRTNVQRTAQALGPFLTLPHGNVRVGAAYVDGHGGITQLAFGGGTGGNQESHSRSWETTNQISWLSGDNRHRLSFGQSIAFTWTSASSIADPFGTFSYQSLADLLANRPASYTRTLSSASRSTEATSSALWVGAESHLRNNALQLQYGLRLDFAHSGTVPAYNPAIDSLFGRRTDRVPGVVGLSPRFGFSWTPTRGSPGIGPPGFGRRNVITLSGGVGAFRGVIPPSRIAGLVDATGLPNALRQLTCVGDATPVPDWERYATDPSAVPSTCLDGTALVEFSTTAPSVQVFDPSYRPPTSWRGNLELRGLSVHGWQLGLGATYSLGVNGESGIDLNRRRAPVFPLPAEGNRPVFVPPEGIVPTTGVVAPAASRLTERFGSVTSLVSDLRTVATQLSATLTPPRPLFGVVPFALSYTFNHARSQERGFTGSTAGDPFRREWASATQPTHQLWFNTSLSIPGVSLASLSLQVRLTSGIPYTPMVAGDVNGDGHFNDRAFIFDPATTSDTALARQMRDLLASAPSRTRECLTAQLGRVAGRNSCRTGWHLQPDVNLNLNIPWQSFGMGALGDRLHLSVTTTNAMGALLRLVGLENTSLARLTGSNVMTDPTLLYVDGFDPATRQFRYRVNQQFGEGRPQRIRASRFSGAFQVQIGGELVLGGPPHRSMAQQLGLVSTDKKAPPPAPDEIRARLRSLTMNPVTLLLQLRDSLLLSEVQIEALETAEAAFTAQMDSLMAPIVQYVVDHGERSKDKEFQKRIGKVQSKVYPLMLEALRRAMAGLKPEQRDRLPPYLRSLAEPEGGRAKS